MTTSSPEGSAVGILRELLELLDAYPAVRQYLRMAALREPGLSALEVRARKLVKADALARQVRS